jgi:tRNA(Leu) C34 or U34 (ribose-2'-O)-methylase TrmL
VQDQPYYFGIGIYQGKHWENVGVLWRGAYQLGASFIFTVGARYRRRPTDTEQSWQHIPLFQFNTFDEMMSAAPYSAPLVAIEEGGIPLPSFVHPRRGIYLLGAEDSGLPASILARSHQHVSIPALRKSSYNVAMAGTLVMYDRMVKRGSGEWGVGTGDREEGE